MRKKAFRNTHLTTPPVAVFLFAVIGHDHLLISKWCYFSFTEKLYHVRILCSYPTHFFHNQRTRPTTPPPFSYSHRAHSTSTSCESLFDVHILQLRHLATSQQPETTHERLLFGPGEPLSAPSTTQPCLLPRAQPSPAHHCRLPRPSPPHTEVTLCFAPFSSMSLSLPYLPMAF